MSREENAPVLQEFKAIADTLKTDLANLVADQKKSVDQIAKDGKVHADTVIKLEETVKGIQQTFEAKEKEYQKSIKDLEKSMANANAFENAGEVSKNIKSFNKVLKSHNRKEIQLENVAEIKSAFDKYICFGKEALEDSEKKFLNTIVDSSGGFLVVPEYNQAVEAKEFDSHGFMGACDTRVIGSSEFKTIVDWEDYDQSFYENELDETTPSDDQDFKEVTIHAEQQIYTKKLTRNILEDSMINIESYILEQLRMGMLRKDGTNLITGNGVDKPRGILTYADGSTYGTIEQITGTTGSGVVGWLEILKLLPSALKDNYHANASYVMPRAAFFSILTDKSGGSEFQVGSQVNFFDKSGVSMRLLGYPVVFESAMPAVAAASLSIAFGDMRRAYTYVKRLGVSIIRDETNPRYIKLHLRQRAGGNVINFESLKLLKTKS